MKSLTTMPLNELLTTCAVGMALIVLVGGVLLDLWRKKDSGLEAHLLRASAAGSIPTGIMLIRAGFDPSILGQLSGINVYITFAGFALVYVSTKAMTSIYERPKKPAKEQNVAPTPGPETQKTV
jgi:hypothetical protein